MVGVDNFGKQPLVLTVRNDQRRANVGASGFSRCIRRYMGRSALELPTAAASTASFKCINRSQVGKRTR
jgi:hypothetical protein